MKLFKLTFLFSLLIFLVTCGKESNTDINDSLVGEWVSYSETQITLKNDDIVQSENFAHGKSKNVTFIFNENGQGVFRSSLDSSEGELGLRTYSFTYQVLDNVLTIRFNEGEYNPCDQYNVEGCGIYKYTLDADVLTTVAEIMHEPSATIDRSTIIFTRK